MNSHRSVRRFVIFLALLAAAAALVIAAAAVAVGAGAPNAAAFVNAYDRGLFSTFVGQPTSDVTALSGGGGALVQEFPSLANAKLNYALIEPNPGAPVSQNDTLQVYSDIYTFYTSIGASVAGLPTIDTTACPANSFGTCDYQTFTKDYALFVYSGSLAANYSVADPFYTRWNNGGAAGGALGVVTSAQTSVTSVSGVAGTQQAFIGGTIYSYPAGSTTPSVYAVLAPSLGAYESQLGFPTSEAFLVNNTGLMRQTFEYGRIEWTGTSTPNVLFSVGEVDITYASQGLNLMPGATATISATTLDIHGLPVTGRVLTWSTANGTVATVAGNGPSAVVTGVSAGTANIYATSEGKTSAPLIVTVGSGACCAVGQGAPTPAIAQAFQTAITRNQISVTLPTPSPVTRIGNGYVQTFTSSDGSGTPYAVAQADGSATAWLLTGALYNAYTAYGGFTAALGYPASDPSSGGYQQFGSGALLAGMPVHEIPVPLAARWLALGAAAAGQPASEAAAFRSYTGARGLAQSFANGSLFGLTSGTQSGQAFFSSGLILARYLALSGPASGLGAPISDVYTNGPAQQENFEGGYIDLQPGASAAVEHYNPRHPSLTAAPSVVVPGGSVHLSATGFAPGASLGFTITGQPSFSVQTGTGIFQWDVLIASNAAPGTIAVQAKAQGSTDAASASYTIAPAAALLPTLRILSGDRQTGYPGGLLAAPIIAKLQDSAGNAIGGAAVSVSGSPGAAVQTGAATDQNGVITIYFRLPPAAGVAVGSVAAGGLAANFSALAAPGAIPGFPVYTQSGSQSALSVAIAGLLGSTPAAVNQYLAANNGFVQTETGAMAANPWIAARSASAGLIVENAGQDRIRDLLAGGTPVVVNLNLTVDGSPAGSTSVDAIGVNADSSIGIADPNPAYAQTSLAAYLNGFAAQGHAIAGTISSILHVGAAQAAQSFTMGSQLSAGAVLSFPGAACVSVDVAARFQYCDGTQAAYEADFTSPNGASLVDFSGPALQIPANAGTSWSISRKNGSLAVSPATASVSGVTDAAGFNPLVSPGALIGIFGSGFAGTPSVTLNGTPLQVLASFPFQINAAVPAGSALGSASLQVSGADGTASIPVTVSAASPGIFQVGALGAILNADATLNSPSNPAMRGQYVSIYGTGLGAPSAPKAMVVLNGTILQPLYAGPVAGFVGLDQVNVAIPAGLAPGLTGAVAIQQGAAASNSVPLAIQ